MAAAIKKLPIAPRALEWLGEALKLPEVFSDKSALEEALESFPVISLEEWPAGVDVVQEGELGDDFFVVYSGRLTAWRTGNRQQLRKLGSLGSGAFFGEIGFLLKAVRSATVRTETDCRLFRIPAHELTSLLRKHRRFSRWVKRVACKRLVRVFAHKS